MRRQRLGALVLSFALALLTIAALRDFVRLGDALPWKQLYDAGDFYCAGAAINKAADPYRYEPLHQCEHAVNASAASRNDPHRVIPAPLPPYDFPPFMLLAKASFHRAQMIDAIAIALAVGGAIWGLSLLAIPLDIAALALAFPAGYLLLAAGQVVPFALVSLVFCGVALARKRDGTAGVLAALTLIEPHLGLPVCVALLAWVPRSRAALAASCVLLGCVALSIAGYPTIVEYVTRVLPAQASAEAGYAYQYSLTYLLHTIGVPAPAALLIGDLSYAATLVFGVWLARRSAQRLERRELLAYLPAALSLFGGPYVHMVDLALAIPAALVVVTYLRGPMRCVAAVGLILLAVPWIDVWITKKLFLATLVVIAALLYRLQVGAGLGFGTFATVAAAIYVLELWPPAALAATTLRSFAPSDLAQDAWRQYVTQLGSNSPLWFAVKLPTWLALSGLIACVLAAKAPRTHIQT